MIRKYDDEFKRNAVKKVLDGQAVKSVSQELGVNESQLHKWRRAALAAGSGNKISTELPEATALRKRIRELEMENEILKKAALIFGERKLKRYSFVNRERENYSLRLLCRVMQVSAGGYYAWRKRLSKPPCLKRKKLADLVRDCYFENRRRYGTRRISKSLAREGFNIGRAKVRRLMQEQNLKAIQPKSFKPRTTDSRGVKASPNLLAELQIEECAAGKIIIGDITYLPLQRGGRFCYLAVWQDKVTRRVVGWSLAETMSADLVISALNRAIHKGLIKAGAIIHSDRGSQYAANTFRELLSISCFRQSMSGKGNCYDNAQAESFFSRFKAELLEGGVFEDIEQARSEIFSYIDGFYNRVRLHSGLGYKTPLEFEMELKTKNGGMIESSVSTFS